MPRPRRSGKALQTRRPAAACAAAAPPPGHPQPARLRGGGRWGWRQGQGLGSRQAAPRSQQHAVCKQPQGSRPPATIPLMPLRHGTHAASAPVPSAQAGPPCPGARERPPPPVQAQRSPTPATMPPTMAPTGTEEDEEEAAVSAEPAAAAATAACSPSAAGVPSQDGKEGGPVAHSGSDRHRALTSDAGGMPHKGLPCSRLQRWGFGGWRGRAVDVRRAQDDGRCRDQRVATAGRMLPPLQQREGASAQSLTAA